MTLLEINTLVFSMLSEIASLLLTPPYNWFTAAFLIGCVIAIINRIINITR